MIFIAEKTKTQLEELFKHTNDLYIERFHQLYEEDGQTPKKLTKNEIKDICLLQVDGELKNFIRKEISPLLPMKYSYCGIRYEYVYLTKPGQRLNASDPQTANHIISAVIYQIMANWEEFETLPEKELPTIILFYILKTSLNVNCSCTFNYPGGFSYDPLGV